MVDIHLRAFTGFFLAILGEAFLSELYSAILEDPSGISFASERSCEIVGFVAGTDHPRGLYTRLLRRRWWRFALASIGPVLRDPGIIPRLMRALNAPSTVSSQENVGTLMSIAVLPCAQGKGMGEALVSAFLEACAQRGLTHVNLATDRIANDSVNRFYQNLGFACVRTYTTPEGREMNEYVMALAPRESLLSS